MTAQTPAEAKSSREPTVMPDLVERLRDAHRCGFLREWGWIEEAADEILRLRAEMEKMAGTLRFIEKMGGMTLIAPSLGPDGDEGHQSGAFKAFNQCADAVRDILLEVAP